MPRQPIYELTASRMQGSLTGSLRYVMAQARVILKQGRTVKILPLPPHGGTP